MDVDVDPGACQLTARSSTRVPRQSAVAGRARKDETFDMSYACRMWG